MVSTVLKRDTGQKYKNLNCRKSSWKCTTVFAVAIANFLFIIMKETQ